MLTVFRFQARTLRQHPGTVAGLALVALITLYCGYAQDRIVHALAYLAAMWVCSVLIDLYALRQPAPVDIPIRNARRESVIVLLCAGLGMLLIYLRFNGPWRWEALPGYARLAIGLPMIVFVFPIALAAVMLILRYKPRDLGIRWNGMLVVLPIMAIVAGTARVAAPYALTLGEIEKASGGNILADLLIGIVSAGLAEEFWKMVAQTRLGAALRNWAMGWLTATAFWALLHLPKAYSDHGNLAQVTMGCVAIIPMGLMWGYITHRTRSILPATIVHGTNVWGLQNL